MWASWKKLGWMVEYERNMVQVRHGEEQSAGLTKIEMAKAHMQAGFGSDHSLATHHFWRRTQSNTRGSTKKVDDDEACAGVENAGQTTGQQHQDRVRARRFKHHQNSTKGPPKKEMKERKLWREREKIAKFWPPPGNREWGLGGKRTLCQTRCKEARSRVEDQLRRGSRRWDWTWAGLWINEADANIATHVDQHRTREEIESSHVGGLVWRVDQTKTTWWDESRQHLPWSRTLPAVLDPQGPSYVYGWSTGSVVKSLAFVSWMQQTPTFSKRRIRDNIGKLLCIASSCNQSRRALKVATCRAHGSDVHRVPPQSTTGTGAVEGATTRAPGEPSQNKMGSDTLEELTANLHRLDRTGWVRCARQEPTTHLGSAGHEGGTGEEHPERPRNFMCMGGGGTGWRRTWWHRRKDHVISATFCWGKEAEQENQKSSRNAAVKIPHASFGFPSGFRTNQPTDARDHEVQRPQDWKQRQEPEQTVVSQAGSSNGGTEEPEVRIDGNCGCQEVSTSRSTRQPWKRDDAKRPGELCNRLIAEGAIHPTRREGTRQVTCKRWWQQLESTVISSTQTVQTPHPGSSGKSTPLMWHCRSNHSASTPLRTSSGMWGTTPGRPLASNWPNNSDGKAIVGNMGTGASRPHPWGSARPWQTGQSRRSRKPILQKGQIASTPSSTQSRCAK